jgi:hypothetical protein
MPLFSCNVVENSKVRHTPRGYEIHPTYIVEQPVEVNLTENGTIASISGLV